MKTLKTFALITLIAPLTSLATETFEDGVLTVKAGTELSRRYTDRTDIAKVIFEDNIQKVRYGAFFGCTGIKEVIFLGSIPYFNEAAFYKCDSIERQIQQSTRQ